MLGTYRVWGSTSRSRVKNADVFASFWINVYGRDLTRLGGGERYRVLVGILILCLGEASSYIDPGDDGMKDREVVEGCEEVSDGTSVVGYPTLAEAGTIIHAEDDSLPIMAVLSFKVMTRMKMQMTGGNLAAYQQMTTPTGMTDMTHMVSTMSALNL